VRRLLKAGAGAGATRPVSRERLTRQDAIPPAEEDDCICLQTHSLPDSTPATPPCTDGYSSMVATAVKDHDQAGADRVAGALSNLRLVAAPAQAASSSSSSSSLSSLLPTGPAGLVDPTGSGLMYHIIAAMRSPATLTRPVCLSLWRLAARKWTIPLGIKVMDFAHARFALPATYGPAYEDQLSRRYDLFAWELAMLKRITEPHLPAAVDAAAPDHDHDHQAPLSEEVKVMTQSLRVFHNVRQMLNLEVDLLRQMHSVAAITAITAITPL